MDFTAALSHESKWYDEQNMNIRRKFYAFNPMT